MRSPLLLLLAVLPGCASASRSAAHHREQWETRKLTAYAFEYQRQCFCLANMIWWRVEVRGDSVASAALLDPADTIATAATMTLAEHPTITNIFDRLQNVLAVRGASMQVTYDSALSYPTTIIVDEDKDSLDDEWELRVRNVRSLQ